MQNNYFESSVSLKSDCMNKQQNPLWLCSNTLWLQLKIKTEQNKQKPLTLY